MSSNQFNVHHIAAWCARRQGKPFTMAEILGELFALRWPKPGNGLEPPEKGPDVATYSEMASIGKALKPLGYVKARGRRNGADFVGYWPPASAGALRRQWTDEDLT